MHLIAGLGNPGKSYMRNRHNVGFMFVERLVKHTDDSVLFAPAGKFDAESAEIFLNGEKCLVIKPQTYMNRSGRPVARAKDFYKINLNHVFVVHDELDIPLGQFKIQLGTGPKVHNGITSINEAIGDQYMRIRIGVDNRTGHRIPGESYVLQNFTDEEISILEEVFTRIQERLLTIIKP